MRGVQKNLDVCTHYTARLFSTGLQFTAGGRITVFAGHLCHRPKKIAERIPNNLQCLILHNSRYPAENSKFLFRSLSVMQHNMPLVEKSAKQAIPSRVGGDYRERIAICDQEMTEYLVAIMIVLAVVSFRPG